MITVSLHNKIFELNAETSLTTALPLMNIEVDMAAIAINKIFIPRSQYKTTVLQQGDQLEIVTPMQGG